MWLFGRVDAGGLPYAIPANEAHLPFFKRETKEIVCDAWFGQRLLDMKGVQAAFALGFGAAVYHVGYEAWVAEYGVRCDRPGAGRGECQGHEINIRLRAKFFP